MRRINLENIEYQINLILKCFLDIYPSLKTILVIIDLDLVKEVVVPFYVTLP